MALMRWFVHSACHDLGYPNEGKDDGTSSGGGVMYQRSKQVNLSQSQNQQIIIGTSRAGAAETHQYYSESGGFQMPLHYPRYTKADYEKMEEWKLDLLLREYGLSFEGSLDEKRAYAMGAFLWPHQY